MIQSSLERQADQMNSTQFTQAFHDGYHFETIIDHHFEQITFSVYSLGELVLTSGKLVACDPLSYPNAQLCFDQQVPTGRYPVKLSLATFHHSQEQRVAYALLILGKQPAVRWELALCPGEDLRQLDPDKKQLGYRVNSGTGCFMDGQAIQRLFPLSDEEFDQFYERLDQALDRTYKDTWDWANLCLDETTGLNIMAFHSGWGEGCYPSYWGYDQQGNLVSLITDFKLFD